MSWFLNSIPYVLAGLTILLGFLQVLKEWHEYDKKRRLKRLRITVLLAFIALAALTFVSLHFENKAKHEDKNKSEADIKDLTTQVQDANNAQANNTKLFLEALRAMGKEVGDLKTEVKTEALQKKLASVQAELLNTQKALAPGPKAVLIFTFVPFPNLPSGDVPVNHVNLPLNADGSVHVEIAVLNNTDVEAANVELNVHICDTCKFAKEPFGLSKAPDGSNTTRILTIPHLQARSVFQPISLDIIGLSRGNNAEVGFSYRCTTCILPTGPSTGTFHVL
jgi:hypothetical protein